MRLSRPALLAAVSATALTGSLFLSTGAADAATSRPNLPSQLFAPYFQSYRGTNLADASKASGAKWTTIAFLETTNGHGSCTAGWRDAGYPAKDGVFTTSISKVRAAGGDVIMSFGGGGAAASSKLTDLADSCTSSTKVAAEIERIVTLYDLKRIDFDVEGASLNNKAGVDRRNAALAKVLAWAKSKHRSLQVQYTLPVAPYGLLSNGLNVLKSANKYHVPVTVVNTMTFDYWDGAKHDMAKDTIGAMTGLHKQLKSLNPAKTDAQLWAMQGATEMIGIDDYGPKETFTLANADTVVSWAKGKHLGLLSFWALQRDNGGCPGQYANATADHCSGVKQTTWAYTKKFAAFTKR